MQARRGMDMQAKRARGVNMYTGNAIGRGAVMVGFMLLAGVPAAMAQVGWTSPDNVDWSNERYSVSANVSLDSSGYVHIVWREFKDSSNRIRHATNRPGYFVKTEVPSGVGGAGTPRLVITPDDVLHVFFDWGSDPTHCYVVSKPASGGSWSAPVQLTTGWGNMGGAAVDASGGIYFVYTVIRFDPDRGENYGRYKPLGGSWGPAEMIRNSGHGWPSGNYVTAYGNKFFIGYTTSDSKSWLKVRDNGVLGPEITVSDPGFAPQVHVNPVTGEWAALYHIDWTNWIRTSTNQGASWSSAMDLLPGGYLDYAPAATFDANGDLHVVWQREAQEGAGTTVYYRPRIRGIWRETIDLTPWALGAGGADPRSITANGADVHVALPANYSPDDFLDIVHMKRPNSVGADTTAPSVVAAASADPSSTEIEVSWTNPQELDFTGTMVRYSTTGYPTGPTDGSLLVNMTGHRAEARSTTHASLLNGVRVYYSIFSYDDLSNYSAAAQVAATPYGPADFDDDGDVDQDDFARFQACLTGAGVPQYDPDCIRARLDDDGSYYGDKDVDVDDLALFMGCVSGADVYADPNCLP